MDLPDLIEEVFGYISDIKIMEEGEHIWSNYQKVTSYLLRLQEIHNEIALAEITGVADTELKKFRTLIIDPTIERLEKVGAYESRKISAMQLESNIAFNKNS